MRFFVLTFCFRLSFFPLHLKKNKTSDSYQFFTRLDFLFFQTISQIPKIHLFEQNRRINFIWIEQLKLLINFFLIRSNSLEKVDQLGGSKLKWTKSQVICLSIINFIFFDSGSFKPFIIWMGVPASDQ